MTSADQRKAAARKLHNERCKMWPCYGPTSEDYVKADELLNEDRNHDHE